MESRKRVRSRVLDTSALPDGSGKLCEAVSDEEAKGSQRTNL
jgi:hypothetical protein